MGTSLKSKFVFVLVGCTLFGLLPGSTVRGVAQADLNDTGPKTGVRQLIPETPQYGGKARVELDPRRTSSLRFAVIGDYGDNSQEESDVADLVKSWVPDLVLTTGDNNYNEGSAETIDENIGRYYSDFIFPYTGIYGDGAQVNRFFPSLGNHDWRTLDVNNLPYPYLEYFELPGNERYYDFTWGTVHFFILDSDTNEPDGHKDDSVQAGWLQTQLANSIYPWKIVVMHHAPYSSGNHGNTAWMQWPFAAWGADFVLAGHDHTHERISPEGDIPYFVNGLGGRSIYDFQEQPVSGSQIRYNGDYGAMRVDVFSRKIRFQFINRQGEVIDDFSLVKQFEIEYLPLVRKTSP